MPIPISPQAPIRISPQAEVLPANTLRFYLHFPRPAEAHFDRDHLWLLDEEEQVVRDPFLVLSSELWSLDGSRLTVLMEPGRIKRGLGADRPTNRHSSSGERTASSSRRSGKQRVMPSASATQSWRRSTRPTGASSPRQRAPSIPSSCTSTG